MSSTENNYVNTDLGNVALNSCGEYNADSSYEYLDTVNYEGGSYFCKVEFPKKISGIAPKAGVSTEFWQLLTIPGDATSEYIKLHDEVVNKAKQVETSRAAVELSQQEVEAAQADVSQMRQDTQEAAEEAASSRDSAAGYAQSAETSRTAAKESEDNINAQVTEFDTHVAEKTSAAETAITEARRAAVNAVSTKQDDATQAVTDEGDKQIKNVEDAGTEQVGKAKSAGASAVSAAGAAGVSAVNAVKAQQTASIKAVADEGTQQVTAVNTAGSTQVSTIETKGADQVKAIKEAGENALQNISNGVDKGLSEEGKAADAKATGKAISNLTEDIDNLNDKKITKFYASNLGETHITDSDDGKIQDMMLYGRSEQKQYRGKNLLPTTMYSDSNVTKGVTFINNGDGSVTVSGTATDIIYFTLWGYNVLGDKGVLQGIAPGDVLYVSDCLLQQTNSKTIVSSVSNMSTQFYDSTTTMYVAIRVNKGETINKTFYPQIEKGSEATSYEPYVGGQPSPSPNYPQKIKSVVSPIVKVCGANLLKFDFVQKSSYGVIIDVIENKIRFHGTISNSYAFWDLNNRLVIKKGTKVSLYVDNYNNHGIFVWFRKVDNHSTLQILNKSQTSITLKEDSYLSQIGIEQYTVGDTIDFTTTLAILDNTNQYEPYHEQTVTLPYTLNAIPVSKDGNVTINGQQYVADYVDVEKGVLVRKINSVKLNGLSFRYEKTPNNKNDTFIHDLDSLQAGTPSGNALCKYASFDTTQYDVEMRKDCRCYVWRTSLTVQFKPSVNIDSVDKFTKWLESNSDASILYVLATPQEISLAPEEIIAFKALATYYPTTNISVNSEQLDGYTVFNYPISMQNGWNYVKQQLNDNRDYIYDMDTQSAEAYINSEYAVALTELEV